MVEREKRRESEQDQATPSRVETSESTPFDDTGRLGGETLPPDQSGGYQEPEMGTGTTDRKSPPRRRLNGAHGSILSE